MKNQIDKIVLLWLIAIIMALTLNSCRSVQKDKSNLTEIVKTEDVKNELEITKEESNIKKTDETKIDSQTGTVTKKTTTKPVDPTKPATTTDKEGNKKTLENAEITEEETTVNNKTVTDSKNAFEENLKKEMAKSLEETNKALAEIDQKILNLQKKPNYWQLLWLIIPFGIIIYIFKNRKLISEKIKNIWWF